MLRTLIWGTGNTGRRIKREIGSEKNIIAFLDNDSCRWGQEIEGVKIIGGISALTNIDYDEIIIASLPGIETIKQELVNVGVPIHKINTGYVETSVNARINFLRDFSAMNQNNIEEYAVAEGGVYQGDFSKEINKYFPKNKLYLFDTFTGFDEKDVKLEEKNGWSEQGKQHLGNTNENMVLEKLPYQQNAVICKGYFPETTKGLENEKFFFVNLDFDLYQPTLEGLRFFSARMVRGGVILVHDYFTFSGYRGIAEAVKKFEDENEMKLFKIPIGDSLSIGIVGF